ncbi:MAG: hypothetical protein IKH81_05570 [Clostridia bacterium]|nr:hypothetical protein [Clostridia bacterium]
MKRRLVSLLLALVLLIPCAASAVTYYHINTGSVRLWYLPDYNAKVLDSYRQDWALTIDQTVEKTWASITFSNGRSGYVEKKYLTRDRSYAAWITQDNTKLKHGPGYVFKNEGSLDRGARVTVLTHGRGFDYVRAADGTCGYVSNNLLSKKKVNPTPAPAPSEKDVNYPAWVVSQGGSVGLRTAASRSNDVVFGKYPPGTEVTVLKELENFVYVVVSDGNVGYMRKEYVSKYKPAPVPTEPPAPVFNPYTTTAKNDASGKGPRLYQGEGLGWSSVRLDVGTVVNVTAKGKDPYWVKVEVDGSKGYMPLKFLN